ncbi:MAG: PAS domain S-box protein [Elusimicrobia bacterium]|nr:PAS domain S-box protein [Elusimicrobiota bacterium]
MRTSAKVAKAEELTQPDVRFRLLVENVRDHAIFMLDPRGRVRTWNPGAERITGFSTGDIVGRSFETLFASEDVEAGKPQAELKAAADVGTVEDEGWRLRKGEGRYWASEVVTAVRDARGDLLGFAKVIHDLTERRDTDARLRRTMEELQASNKELEAFSYSVSHDLRAPLRHISSYVTMLRRELGQQAGEAAQHNLTKIDASIQRANLLIDALMDLGRLSQERVRLEPVSLSAMVSELSKDLASREPSRRADVRIEKGVVALGDRVLLRAALTNLLNNAWKFTRTRSSAEISFGSETVDGIRAFFIRDNGVGFDMVQANRLFEPFKRCHSLSEYPGSGVGLAIVKRIVDKHGGRVWARAEADRGATFYFTLCARGAPASGEDALFREAGGGATP